RPYSYFDRDRRRTARSTRRRRSYQRDRPAHRYLARRRRRRPARQQDRIGRARDPHSLGHRSDDAGRPLAASQPRQGPRGAAHAALRSRTAEAGRGARRRTPRPGRYRRPLRTHPHLQFPAGPRLRPSHQSHPLQAAADHGGRGAGRDHRCPCCRASGCPACRRGRLMNPPAAVSTTHPRDDNAGALTIAAARRTMAQSFRAAGLDSPELDARILVGHALGLDQAALAAAGVRVLARLERDTIEALARRRLAREPVARIVGYKEFWSLKLSLTEATLVPRPETETVVEAALAAIDAQCPRARVRRIADLGTGSGALVLALMSELPSAFGVGTDTGERALTVARANAERLGVAPVAFIACDM